MTDKQSKTEEATPKRIRESKKKGQVSKSGDFSPAISLLIFTMTASALGNFLLINGMDFLRGSLTSDYSPDIDVGYVRNLFINNFINASYILLPYAAIAITVGIVANLIQTGFIFTTHPLKPDFKRINPIEGFKNIFSKKVLFNLVKNILKLSLVFYLSYRSLSDSINKILNSGNIGTNKLFYFFLDFVKELTINIVFIMLGLAIIDFVFQRRDFKKNLRMSKQEIKDEFKEMEGNPQIKSARQQRQRELAMSRMMASVPSSTVIITNPTHIAVALRYDSKKDNAPLVIAKGVDHVANKIKEVAKENKVPIIENRELARAMYKKIEIGEYVPVELYKAVAEILALVFQLKEKNKHKI